MIRSLLMFGVLASASPALAEEIPRARFTSVMDATFGAGKWRQTGGYRTPARENELRSQGAMTVRPGARSQHSMGRPDAPGAYDLVVDGLTPAQAAEKLRLSGAPFSRLFAEGAHGGQGPHLHLEPSKDLQGAAAGQAAVHWIVAEPTAAESATTRLREAAVAGDADGQVRLASAYQRGLGARPDPVAAYFWLALAASNPAAASETRREADRALAALEPKMKREDRARAERLVRTQLRPVQTDADSCRGSQGGEGESPVVVIGPGPAANCPEAR